MIQTSQTIRTTNKMSTPVYNVGITKYSWMTLSELLLALDEKASQSPIIQELVTRLESVAHLVGYEEEEDYKYVPPPPAVCPICEAKIKRVEDA